MKYIIVEECNKERFEKKINDMISKGYNLQGSVSTTKRKGNSRHHIPPENRIIYTQGMFK